jgi:phage-related tail protein
LEIFVMTATSTMRTDNNGPVRKTLASQLDRLDAILDGLDNALAGAVQAVVCTAVKEAVQAVLTEVLTNQQLQEQLQQATPHGPPPEEPQRKQSMASRLWQATTEGVRRTVQKVKRLGRGVGMTLMAAGGVLAGVIYAARKKIASAATVVYRHGRRLVQAVVSSLTGFLPTFAFGG